MQIIDMIIYIIAENIVLYLFFRELNFRLDKKREREVCKFYLEKELSFILLIKNQMPSKISRPTYTDKKVVLSLIRFHKFASSALFQRNLELKMSYPAAAKTMEWLENKGIIEPFDGKNFRRKINFKQLNKIQ